MTLNERFSAGRYVDAATVLVVISAAVYLIGWNYVDAHYEALGLQHSSIDLPSTRYLEHAFLPGMFFLPFLPVLLDIADSSSPLSWLETHSVLLLVGATLAGFGSAELPNTRGVVLLVTGFLLFFVPVFSSRIGVVVSRVIRPKTLRERLSVVVGITLVLLLAARLIGQIHARNILSGRTKSVRLELKVKSEHLRTMLAKPMILLLFHNGAFYLTEVAASGSARPVYVVPLEQVEYAVQYNSF
jgi:hypothetical protein